MIEKIKRILSSLEGLDGWKINEKITESKEAFFVKKDIDMLRSKDVHHIYLTVYKDFEEDGVKYRGSSMTEIHPTMDEEEVKRAIEESLYSASFVKNKYYPLVGPNDKEIRVRPNKFDQDSLSNWISILSQEAYLSDIQENGWINSLELFLDKNKVRILNSEGLDLNYSSYRGELEFISNWKEGQGEIELYKNILFSTYDKGQVEASVKEMLLMAKDRAMANPTPQVKDIPLILSGDPVKEFFNYYYSKASSRAIYNKTSTIKIGDNIQGSDIKGDKISMYLDPDLDNSTFSAPLDSEGQVLERLDLYRDGVLQNYWGNNRFSYYLDIKPSGNMLNMVVGPGSKDLLDLRQGIYLELVAFSDFQMDTLTGDFAGEIRLGYYNDGQKTIPITGGSISGNVNEVHSHIYLSKEIQSNNNFMGPKSIKLINVKIGGVH